MLTSTPTEQIFIFLTAITKYFQYIFNIFSMCYQICCERLDLHQGPLAYETSELTTAPRRNIFYLCYHKPTSLFSCSILTSVSCNLMLDILTYSADSSLPIQFLFRSIDTFAVVPLPIKGS